MDVLEFQMFVKLKSCHLLNRTMNMCVKHALSFEGASSPLSTKVDNDVTHVINGTLQFCTLQEINSWTVGRSESEARIPCSNC